MNFVLFVNLGWNAEFEVNFPQFVVLFAISLCKKIVLFYALAVFCLTFHGIFFIFTYTNFDRWTKCKQWMVSTFQSKRYVPIEKMATNQQVVLNRRHLNFFFENLGHKKWECEIYHLKRIEYNLNRNLWNCEWHSSCNVGRTWSMRHLLWYITIWLAPFTVAQIFLRELMKLSSKYITRKWCDHLLLSQHSV